MIAFLADEDFPFPAVVALRVQGHDVMTLAEAGLAGVGTPDTEVLTEATNASRVLLTMNRRHFTALHAQNPDHAGIVVCTPEIDFEALANRILAAVVGHTSMCRKHVVVRKPHPAA